MKITIYLFGDSITRGSFDTESSGWADRIKAEANIKTVNNELEPLITVYNMGIGGNNTNDLLKRFKFETEQRLVRDSEIYFLFSFGTNDSAIYANTGEHAINIDQYAKNIRQVIAEAKEYSKNILFLTSPPVIDEITKKVSSIGKSRLNSDIIKYNNILISICSDLNIELVDIYKLFLEQGDYRKLYYDDGVHPNSDGHKLIFNAVRDYYIHKNIM